MTVMAVLCIVAVVATGSTKIVIAVVLQGLLVVSFSTAAPTYLFLRSRMTRRTTRALAKQDDCRYVHFSNWFSCGVLTRCVEPPWRFVL